ncbi:unnamed protein product [Adineta ricciae]|uniref:Fatty acid hydroxylase domain-containing protein n=1 Tax=Adineta ricciae TaxID=249248 RepID=A0A814SIJ9_ADIRI|nr:unnamed protein product [Adineta ricciae]CAF1148767.1 unnamed protein product [Adineta ricciae]
MSTTVTSTQSEIRPSAAYKLRATAKWVEKPFWKRNPFEHLAAIDLASKKCYEVQPKNPNAPPAHNVWWERLWLSLAIPPPLIFHALWYYFVPETNYYHTWHPGAAYAFYAISFLIYTIVMVKHIHYYMDYYGTFDEDKRPRDYVPDMLVTRLVLSVVVYMLARTGGGLLLGGYNRNESPSLGHTISWFVLIKIAGWLIALDFFFYCYHRACHMVPFLWKVHSLHHCTKHPTPIQSILAGDIQEVIEVFLVPLAASLVVPLTTHEFWIAQCILIYIEATGHSGIRAYWPHCILNEVLQPFGMELCIEDHDLHHRLGKSGMNYGKQTRIFDRIFGTISERVECVQK